MNEIQMTDLQSEVWQFMAQRFVGVENAARRETILARYNLINKKELSDRVFRKVVAVLVTDFKRAICTTPEVGYYVARTSSELDAAVNGLKSKGAAIFDRARALEACEPQEKQGRLPFGGMSDSDERIGHFLFECLDCDKSDHIKSEDMLPALLSNHVGHRFSLTEFRLGEGWQLVSEDVLRERGLLR